MEHNVQPLLVANPISSKLSLNGIRFPLRHGRLLRPRCVHASSYALVDVVRFIAQSYLELGELLPLLFLAAQHTDQRSLVRNRKG